jgi:hypothetical protein
VVAPLATLEVVPPDTLLSTDVEVYVRYDGSFYLSDELVDDADLGPALAAIAAHAPTIRAVVGAHENAPHGRIMTAIAIANESGIEHVAITVDDVTTLEQTDPLFPGASGDVIELSDGLSTEQLNQLRPKRWRFPQNPYAQTDFTAYTLEFGEVKFGLASINYGIFPRVQIGTAPILDIAGVYNGNLKANLMREGPLDGALLAQLYVVPINDLIEQWDRNNELGLFGETANGDVTLTTNILYMGLGAQGSLRLGKPFTLHTGVSYARVQAEGTFDFQNLPELLGPGLDASAEEISLVPRLVGELIQVRLASDLRFNRRDSLILQVQAPVYARAQGAIPGDIEGLPTELENLEFIVAYGDFLALSAGYRASASWQFSWKHIDARAGIGISPLTGSWLLQAFDLSYRFGGRTRRGERDIRRGYDRNRRDLRRGGDSVPDGPPTQVEPSPPSGGSAQ